ncbi:FdtA/QdtA family cupin domain-containing protein [Sphingomonas sp. LHG3406-1]|uniref:sugar 3,4-ketoisomerase n=1 Tax=Sphingomonas sp. LHG3406-1 TaxID=2804617 RepID=UPI0026078B28|nr:FdtA/QdtA family cupin domain-containing protein [Sphingomonas sp. LHG3406-1]
MANLPSGCRIIDFSTRGDERGSLVALEGGAEVPFDIRRVYTIFGTREGVARGFHAHHALNQLAVAVAGSCDVILDDGQRRERVRLERPDQGLTLPPMIWHEMENFSPDCVLMVLAEDVYDEADYIRSYDDFLRLAEEAQA